MASKRIKGITIEIGGDTTKLDKALAATDTQLNKTKANLKDVERLLKMDPGNAELLAQKQRLLAEAMENNTKRAETLREAISNADAALARNVQFKEKYAPLLQSLDEATAAYEKMKNKKEEMDQKLEAGVISTEQYDKWQSELEETRKAYQDLSRQVEAAKKEMGGPMMDQAQFDAVQREYIETKKAAEDATKAFASYNKTAEQVSANADKIAQGADKVVNAVKGISTAAGGAAGALTGLAVEAGKSADDLNTLSKQSGFSTEDLQKWTYASDLVDVAVDDIVSAARKMKKNMTSESKETQAAFARLGVSVEKTSIQLKDAEVFFYEVVNGLGQIPAVADRDAISMQLLGQSFDDVANKSAKEAASAVDHLRDSMASASPETQNAFKEIGVSANQVITTLNDTSDVFYRVLERLSQISNETERDILAMQIFGKSADDLAGIIDDGGAALREYGEEAQALGLILSQDALDKANAFNDGLDTLKAKARATFMEAGAELADTLLPALNDIVDALGDLLKWFAGLDRETLQMLLSVLIAVAGIAPVAGVISSIAKSVSRVSEAIGILTHVFGKLAPAATNAQGALGGISGAVSGIGSAVSGALSKIVGFLAGPAGIAIAVAAAAGGLIYLYETNEKFRGALEKFDQWITGVFTKDWSETFGALGEPLNAIFRDLQNIYEGIKQILGGIVDFVAGVFTLDWERAWQGIVNIFGGIFSTLVAIAKTPINNLIGLVNAMIQFVVDGINSVIGLLNNLSVDVPDWVPGIGGKTLGFTLETITAPKIPYLANGTVTRPNSPFMAVVGDNPNEPEVVSPFSTIEQAVVSGIAKSGGNAVDVRVTVNFAGTFAQLIREMHPYITTETKRLGPQLVK